MKYIRPVLYPSFGFLNCGNFIRNGFIKLYSTWHPSFTYLEKKYKDAFSTLVEWRPKEEYALVWGSAWNLKPFSWAILICYSFFNMSKQFLAPGGLSAEYVQVLVSVM